MKCINVELKIYFKMHIFKIIIRLYNSKYINTNNIIFFLRGGLYFNFHGTWDACLKTCTTRKSLN